MAPSFALRRTLPLLAWLLLMLPACDTRNEDEGYFALRVTFADGSGFATEGRALFTRTDADGPFRLELVPRTRQSGFPEGMVLARRAPGRPEAGSYDFALPRENALPPERFAGALERSFGGSTPPLYYVQQGTLQIESFSGGRLRGRLEAVATRVEAGGAGRAPLRLRLEGQFRAEPSGQVRRFPL